MNKEMDEYLRLTFIQLINDEWTELATNLATSKSIEDAYEIYQQFELRIYNLNRYIELRIKHAEEIVHAQI